MKIHKTVNPVAYENTYYLEGEQHLIVVDPGSNWEAIRKTIAVSYTHLDVYKRQGLYYADFIRFYSPTQLCGGGTTKSNSNELTISVPLSFSLLGII